jgi:uncharacterized damage-inducible protein DinB
MTTLTSDVRYPIGPFNANDELTERSRRAAIDAIVGLPTELRRAVAGLDDSRLDTPYRADGWSVRQVVHHLADSHLTGYVRLKLALTQDNPAIQPYDQAAWGRLADNRLPVAPALAIIDGVNEHWIALCRALDDRALARVYTHAALGLMTVEKHLHFFAWHARHHTAQISTLRERESW